MAKIGYWFCLIVLLIWTNAFWINEFVNSFKTGMNIWIPIIAILFQVLIFLIYHFGSKDYFGTKWEKKDKNPRF